MNDNKIEPSNTEVLKKKKQSLEEEYSDDEIVVGKNYTPSNKEKLKFDEEKGSVNIGAFKRDVLENGQRIGVLEVDKEMVKHLTVDKEGNYTISLKSDRFKGDDFLHQEIKINSKEFNKLSADENGMVKLLVFEKQAGGQIDEKKELVVMKDTEANRQGLIEKNKDVKYTGEERVREREKIMDTPITPNIKFRDVYNQMNDDDKGEIAKKDNDSLKRFINDNKKPMEGIEEAIKVGEVKEKQKTGSKMFLNESESGNRTKVVCMGIDGSGKVIYKDDSGKEQKMNPYEIGEKIDLHKDTKQKISKEAFKEAIGGLNLTEKKNQGIKL